MVQPLPQGCRLTAIFDCCHSGSAMSLPYEYVIPPGLLRLISLGRQRIAERARYSP
jgi:hypothetical protein